MKDLSVWMGDRQKERSTVCVCVKKRVREKERKRRASENIMLATYLCLRAVSVFSMLDMRALNCAASTLLP